MGTLALCIPAYNAAKVLPRLLRSAATQKIPFDEVIVCDDASKDDTAAVGRSLGAKVIVNPANSGCSASKNHALAAATSDWIHFHDADDELLPSFTSLAHSWMARADAPDVVLFNYEYRENDTNKLIATSHFVDEALQKDPVRYAIITQINPFCGLYRRARLVAVGNYDLDPEILYNEDVAFHCKLALAGFSFRAEKEVSIINYRMAGSMSGANQVKCLKAHHAVMKHMAAKVGRKYPGEIASQLWGAATGLAAHLDWSGTDAALRDARDVYSSVPANQSRLFAALCRVVGPPSAFRIREHAIRAFKPGFRRAAR